MNAPSDRGSAVGLVSKKANQRTKVRGQCRPADATGSRLPAPIGGERAPMPTHHGGGRDDLDRPPPPGQTVESTIQSSRSIGRRRGRFGVVRCSTAS